ncbi:MAG: response regulator [Candidatus Eremiobacteraeota bacterium]|nr:response regulator [Candidatus Eremiobacteraeota bacterium]
MSNPEEDIDQILVVNDNFTQLRKTARILQNQGYEVTACSSGVEAVAHLEQGISISLVVTDLHMPEIDGWKLCRLLRSPDFERYNDVPVLAMSAIFCGEDAQNITAGLGANAFLASPFTAAELIDCVRGLLEGALPRIRPRALLVPSKASGFMGLASSFRRCGYSVTVADSVEEAVAGLESLRPEVAILADGHAQGWMRQILHRTWDQTSACVSVVVLEQGSQSSQVQWIREGADACVRAPFEPDYVVNLADKVGRARALMRIHDLLEQKDDELRASQETFQFLYEGIPDMVLVFDRQGQVLSVNENCSARMGAPACALVGRKIWDLLAADHFARSFGSAWADGDTCSYLATCSSQDGFTFEVEVHQRPMKFRGERATLAIVKDVTDRMAAREAVRISETKCRIIAENTYDWEFWRSPQGHFLYSSPACKRISGYEPFEFEMDTNFLFRIAHPQDRHLVPDPEDCVPAEEVESEFRIVDRNGTTRWVDYVSRPVYDEMGNLLGSRGTIRDLTQNKTIENERGRLVAAVEQCAEAIAITDLDGLVQYSNSAFQAIDGSGHHQLADDPEIRSAIERQVVWSGRRRRPGPDGTKLEVELTVSPIRDPEGSVREMVWIEKDVTQEVAMQERLHRAQRMEAIGTLAGGVAHDFNNLLSGILGYSSLLKSSHEDWEETYQAADVIHKAAQRAADLTQKLLGFARRGKNKHEAFSMHETIAEVLTLLSRTTDKRILPEGLLNAEKAWVRGDASQMSQVLLNLAINASHAMADQGGRLTLKTSNVDSTGNSKPSPAGPFLLVEICDEGCGIPRENLKRIFEPFFTTKENGSGLGLAMVYGIVQNHEGHIEVDSRVGHGTTFKLFFPVFEGVRSVPAPAPKAAPVHGRGRILVVDDEEIIRNMANKMLRRLGYDVVTKTDGMEGLSYYREHHQEVDLVILDMIMPNMDGRDCFRALKRVNPEVQAILSTGYSLNQTVQEILDEGLLGVINKPYEFNQIADVVSRALRGARLSA